MIKLCYLSFTRALLLLMVGGLLAACSNNKCNDPYVGDLAAFDLNKPVRCVSPSCLHNVDKDAFVLFKDKPVNVYRVGQSRLISFPSDVIFQGRSSNFSRCAFGLLNAVTTYLQQDDIAVLEVDAYTDNQGSLDRDRLITQEQAGQIVRYLTGKGVAANFIYAVGFGQKAPLASNTADKGRRINRRIELRYRVIKPKENKHYGDKTYG